MKNVTWTLLLIGLGCARATSSPVTQSSTAAGVLAARYPVDDSILARMQIGESTVIASGDTVTYLGAAMVGLRAGSGYAIQYYRLNAQRVLRVSHALGHLPNGQTVWMARSETKLPSLASTERVAFSANCKRDGVADPLLAAIVGTDTTGSSRARLAWRFDRAHESLVPVPPDGVDCPE
jgi:hypothetical protein